jgi:hypothetical protein
LAPTFVNPEYNLQFYGSILDLKDFQGAVIFNLNKVKNNTINYDSCELAKDMINHEEKLKNFSYPTFG